MKLKKIISLLFLTFLVLQNNLKAQEDYEKDSLESLLPYANDLQRADILNGLANCIRDLDSAKAYRYAFQAYTISAKRSYCKGKANAILTLGLLEKNKGNLAQARIHYLNGLLLGLQCNELSAISFAYNCLGNLSFLKSDYKKSIQYYIASVKISEQIGDRRRAAKTYNNIGSIMLELEKLRPAEEYFLRALDLYKGSDNKLVIAKIENNLANIYQNRGYDLKALYHYLNALEVFRAKSSASDVSAALGNIGLVYLKRNQVKKAMPFLHESFNLDLQINNPSSLMISISNLVEAYLLIGKYDSSLYYLNLGLQVNKAKPNISKIAGLYDSAAELFGKLNVKAKQDSFYNLYLQTKKEYVGSEKHTEINIATNQFEKERREQKIRLSEKEKEINELRQIEQTLKDDFLWLIGILSSIFILIVLGLILYLIHIFKQNKKLKLSNKTNSRILHQLNHGIRTPLNGIVGISRLASDSHSMLNFKEIADYLNLGGEELVLMLNNLHVYQQIERHEAHLISAPFDLIQALDELFMAFKPICKSKGLLFNQRPLSGIPRMVNGDKQKLMILVQNLLSHAVQETKKGIVKIEVEQIESFIKDQKKYSTLQFSVTDEGAGLSEKEIKHIFKETSKHIHFNISSGIGFKYIKTLSDLMKGKIKVVSEKGVGSTFIFEIDLELAEDNEVLINHNRLGQLPHNPTNCNILVVESHPASQYLLSKILELAGYAVTPADNGLKALSFLKKFKFDLIIMNLHMPVLNGIETATLIRNSNDYEKNRTIPIIAISAQDDSTEKKKCFEIGINECLNEPIKKEILTKAIHNQLNK